MPIHSHKKYHDAIDRFCMGECAIFAYALQLAIPDWSIGIWKLSDDCMSNDEYENFIGDHCFVVSPCGKFIADAHGVQEYQAAFENHCGGYDMTKDASENFFNVFTEEGLNDFIDLTDHYDIRPQNKETLSNYLEDKFLKQWVKIVAKEVYKEYQTKVA